MAESGMRLPRAVTLVRLAPPFYTGGGIQATRLAEALADKGVPIRVLTSRHPDPAVPVHETRRRVEYHRLRGADDRRHRGRGLAFGLLAASWLLRNREWDLLHIHGFGYWAVAAAEAAHFCGKPVIVTTTLLGADDPAGGTSRGLARWVLLPSYRRSDAFVALSEELERRIRADGHCRGRILRLPNGVDVEHFRPPRCDERDTARAKLGVEGGTFVVLVLGALQSRKNVSGVVRAAALLRSRPVKFVFGGPAEDPDESKRLESALAFLPPGIEVELLGQVPADEVLPLMWAADCLALNSRSEGLPLSLVEAMAAGLPCVATDIPGSRDVLSRGGGRLVPVDNDSALAEALDELAKDRKRRQVLSAAARQIAEQHYSWSRIADGYVELYRDLVSP